MLARAVRKISLCCCLQAALKAALPPNDHTEATRAALAPLTVSAKAAVRSEVLL
jgi:hypothetical protein